MEEKHFYAHHLHILTRMKGMQISNSMCNCQIFFHLFFYPLLSCVKWMDQNHSQKINRWVQFVKNLLESEKVAVTNPAMVYTSCKPINMFYQKFQLAVFKGDIKCINIR